MPAHRAWRRTPDRAPIQRAEERWDNKSLMGLMYTPREALVCNLLCNGRRRRLAAPNIQLQPAEPVGDGFNCRAPAAGREHPDQWPHRTVPPAPNAVQKSIPRGCRPPGRRSPSGNAPAGLPAAPRAPVVKVWWFSVIVHARRRRLRLPNGPRRAVLVLPVGWRSCCFAPGSSQRAAYLPASGPVPLVAFRSSTCATARVSSW